MNLLKIAFLMLSLLQISFSAPMELVYKTDLSFGTTIAVPLAGVVDVVIDWGDGSDPKTVNTEDWVLHTYSTHGLYTVTISGSLERFGLNSHQYSDKLYAVNSFGDLGLKSLAGAFQGARYLTTIPNSLPNTVTDLSNMFCHAHYFNQDLSSWDVSNVTNMSSMFFHNIAFNHPLNNWDVSKVTDMSWMFYNALSFNQDISSWGVSNVTDMSFFLAGAEVFNQDISSWNVSNVTNMQSMLGGKAFNQDISAWDISNVTNLKYMIDQSNLSIENYDALLISWANQLVQSNLTLNARNVQYSAAAASARQKLIDTHNWTIEDGGLYTPVKMQNQLNKTSPFSFKTKVHGNQLLVQLNDFSLDSHYDLSITVRDIKGQKIAPDFKTIRPSISSYQIPLNFKSNQVLLVILHKNGQAIASQKVVSH